MAKDRFSINFDRVKDELEKLTRKGGSDKTFTPSPLIWKPKEKVTKIRLLPLVDSPDFPLIKAYFHYFYRNTLCSPITFGGTDLIAEFVNQTLDKARETGHRYSTEEFKQIVKLRPALRTYALVLVRGEEELGPRFFGFGQKNYDMIIQSMQEESDWGNIFHPIEGRDLTVNYTPKNESSTGFPVISLSISPKTSPISEDATFVKKLLTEQPEFKDAFTPATDEELQDALSKYLSYMEDAPASRETHSSDDDEEEESNQPKEKTSTLDMSAFDAIFDED